MGKLAGWRGCVVGIYLCKSALFYAREIICLVFEWVCSSSEAWAGVVVGYARIMAWDRVESVEKVGSLNS